MKKAFLHIVSTVLAVLVLCSTFSFTVEKHLCGGEVADYSFIGALERCGMPESDGNNTQETSLNQIPCCQDIVETIESSNDELTVVNELDVSQQELVVVFLYSFAQLFTGETLENSHFKEYRPPIVTKDLQIFYDTFLI